MFPAEKTGWFLSCRFSPIPSVRKLDSRLALTAAVVLSALGGITSPVRAGLIPFANFEQASVNPAYSFVNTDKTQGFISGGSKPTQKIPITFSFTVANGYGAANTPIAAVETITAFARGTANQITQDGVTYDSQAMKNVIFTITAKKPIDGKTNLLTISESTGTIFGRDGGTAAVFTGSTELKDTVKFSSDFLDFSKTKGGAYQLALLGVNPALSIAKNDYLSPFKAGVNQIVEGKPTAIFSTDVAPASVPEPTSIVLHGTALALCLCRRCSRSGTHQRV